MNCFQARSLLSAHVDGELFGRVAELVSAHVAACPRCQDECGGLVLVKDMLGRLPQARPLAGFHAGVMARLREEAGGGASAAVSGRGAAGQRPARGRFGWKAGLAAAAVAAFAFGWGLWAAPSAPPLAVGGRGPATGPAAPDAPPAVQPAGPDAATPASPPASPPAISPAPGETPPETRPDPNPGTAPADPTVPEAGGAAETGETAPDSAEPPAPPPDLGGNRYGTASAETPGGERLVAKTMVVSLHATDPEAFAAGLTAVASAYGGEIVPGEDGAVRLLVDNDHAMRAVDAIRELALPDSFRWLSNRERDVTEAVRNLTVERDFLQKAVDAGEAGAQADLAAKEARLADYLHEVNHLALDILVKGPGD